MQGVAFEGSDTDGRHQACSPLSSQSSKSVRQSILPPLFGLFLPLLFPVFCLFSLPCRLSADAYDSLSMRRASAFWSAVSIAMPTHFHAHESCQGMPCSSVPSQLTKARSGLPLLEVGGRHDQAAPRWARPACSVFVSLNF